MCHPEAAGSRHSYSCVRAGRHGGGGRRRISSNESTCHVPGILNYYIRKTSRGATILTWLRMVIRMPRQRPREGSQRCERLGASNLWYRGLLKWCRVSGTGSSSTFSLASKSRRVNELPVRYRRRDSSAADAARDQRDLVPEVVRAGGRSHLWLPSARR